MATPPYPFALAQNLNSRNCCCIISTNFKLNGVEGLPCVSSSLHLRSPSLSVRLMSQSGVPTTNPPESTKTVRCVIKGRVQGVFYRNWAVNNASQLGLMGWVRNRRDGSVEALFSGSPEAVDEMQQRCRRGPPDALVTGFQAFPSHDHPGTHFQLKPTL